MDHGSLKIQPSLLAIRADECWICSQLDLMDVRQGSSAFQCGCSVRIASDSAVLASALLGYSVTSMRVWNGCHPEEDLWAFMRLLRSIVHPT